MPQSHQSTTGASPRRHDLDALRAAAMLLGIGLHAALSFRVLSSWWVHDSRPHAAFDTFLWAIHGFRMPLFFLLSGFFTAMLWRKRGLKSLLWQRFRRIVVPLALCAVTIVPMQGWIGGKVVQSGIKREAAKKHAADAGLDIWAAAAMGSVDAIRDHLANGADVNGLHPQSGNTPLQRSALRGHTDAMEALLASGADVVARGRGGHTALHHAAFLGRVGAARLLIDAGADLDARTGSGATPTQRLQAPWKNTASAMTYLQIELDKDDILAGRLDIAALLGVSGSALGLVPGPTEPKPATLRTRLATKNVFRYMWFLWFLCWLVVGFCAYAIVADRLAWSGLPAWLVLSPVRYLWLAPLTMLPQWYMGAVRAGFGPDTSGAVLPPPYILAYYAIFFGFGALYFDSDDSDGRVGKWWWLTLPLALGVVFPVGMAATFGYWGFHDAIARPELRRLTWSALQVVFAWLMTFGLMGLFRAAFSRERQWVRYMSDSAYWLYLAHPPLILWAQLIVRDWRAPGLVKCVGICVVVTGVLLLSYQTLVRYTPLGTLLNGPRRRPGRAAASGTPA